MTIGRSKPSMAVIIPVKNALPFLAETLESVRAQRYEPLEVVVVDDGSTDGSLEFVRQVANPRIRLIERNDIGPAAARNAGLQTVATELVAFLDADDIWPVNALNRLSQALIDMPEAGFAQGRIRNFSDAPPGGRRFLTMPYEFVNLGANVLRSSIFEQVGMLDEDLRLCEDLDFFMRCWEQNIRKAAVDSVVLHYRRHPRGMTHGLSGAGFGTVKAFKKRIERIRRGEVNLALPRHTDLDSYVGTPRQVRMGAFTSMRANHNTDVSVVIPVHNGERFVCEAIDSVLAQRGVSVDVIVVDNNSTDRTCEVVRERFGVSITLIRESKPGGAAARNAGARSATAPWLAFLDADDLWLPEKLATQIAAAGGPGSADVLFTMGQEFHSEELNADQQASYSLRPLPYALLTPSSMLLKRTAFEHVGEFPDVPVGEFIAWQGWARELGLREYVVPELLVKRRIHQHNMTRSVSNLAGYPMAAKWLLDRRRGRARELALAAEQCR